MTLRQDSMNYRVILGEMTQEDYDSIVKEIREETLDTLMALAASNDVVKYLDREGVDDIYTCYFHIAERHKQIA